MASVPVGAGHTVTVPVTGRGGVPASGADAVALAVAVTGGTADGSVTVYAAGGSQPEAPSVSWARGDAASGIAVPGLGSGGTVAVHNSSAHPVTVTLEADGYWLSGTPAAAGAFGPLAGGRVARVLVGGGRTVTVPVTGHGGVPASGAGTAALAVAVASGFGTGRVTVYPAGARRPAAPSLSWAGSDAASGLVVSALSGSGTVAVHNSSAWPVTVTLDADGYWLSGAPAAAGTFGPAAGGRVARVLVGGGRTVTVPVTGHGGVPASGAGAAALAVQAARGRAAGSVTVYPAGASLPDVPSLSWAAAHHTASGLVVSALSSSGTVAVHNSSAHPVIVTLAAAGYWLSKDRTVSDITAKPTTVTLSGSDITTVSGDPAGTQTVTLAAGTPVPAVGRVLVTPVSDTAPDGLLGTMTAVAGGPGGSHVVTLTPATLDQAYSTFTVSTSQTLTDSDIIESPGSLPSASDGQTLSTAATPISLTSHTQRDAPAAGTSGFGYNLSKASFSCDGSGAGPTVSLTADLSKTKVDLFLNADPAAPVISFLITADPVFDINVGFTGQLTCKLSGEGKLEAKIPVSGAPPLMVDLYPVVELSAGGQASVQFEWKPRAADGFTKGPGISTEVHAFGSSGSVGISAAAGADLFLGLDAELKLAGRIGVGGDFGPDLAAAYDARKVCVTVDGELKADLAADADVLVKKWTFALATGIFAKRQVYSNCGGASPSTPPLALSANLPAGAAGQPYSGTVTATGGDPPYTFSLASGSLPDGLSLTTAGAVSGTPKSSGSGVFTVQVTDSAGTSTTATYTITIDGTSGTGGTGWTVSQGVLPSDGSDEAELTGVSCPPSSPCVVVGNTINGSSYETPFLLTGSGQSWTVTDAPVPGGATMTNYVLGAVSCQSAAQCVAIGAGEFTGDNPVKYGAVAVTKSGGSWSAVQVPLPASTDSSQGLTMTGISCPSASFCVATGYYTDSTANHLEHGLLLTWSGGSWTASQAPLPAGAASNVDVKLTGVSCPSATQCTTTGTYIPNSNVEGLLLTWSGDSWTAAYAPLPSNAETSGQIASATGVSCPSAAQCVVVGYYGDTSGYGDGVLLTGSGSSWTAAEAPRPAGDGNLNSPLAGVSCLSATQCAVLGRAYATPTLLTLSGGSWTAADLPLPSNISGPNDPYSLTLSGISCASAAQCVAVGYYSDTSGHVDELLMTGAS